MNIAVDKLEAGMELAADVLNVNQGLLLGKGTVLNPRHLRILKTWGVERVQVALDGDNDDARPVDAVMPADVLRDAAEQVDRRFRLVRSEVPAVKQIRELAIVRRAHQVVRDRTAPGPNLNR